jgi:hypothetical protein
VVKKFLQIYVDIKVYRPGHDVYVRFMFLHKRVYYMYTFLLFLDEFLEYIGDIYTKYLWVLDRGLYGFSDLLSNILFRRIISRYV